MEQALLHQVPYSALIFDLDGVIIDSETLHNAAVGAAMQQHGVPLPSTIYAEYLGIPDEVFLEYASRTYLGGTVAVATLLADKQRHFLQMQDRVTSIPGAVDFIRRVRGHVGAMALVTSSLRHNQELAFAKFAYDFCTDRGNYFIVADILFYDANKKELLKYIGSR